MDKSILATNIIYPHRPRFPSKGGYSSLDKKLPGVVIAHICGFIHRQDIRLSLMQTNKYLRRIIQLDPKISALLNATPYTIFTEKDGATFATNSFNSCTHMVLGENNLILQVFSWRLPSLTFGNAKSTIVITHLSDNGFKTDECAFSSDYIKHIVHQGNNIFLAITAQRMIDVLRLFTWSAELCTITCKDFAMSGIYLSALRAIHWHTQANVLIAFDDSNVYIASNTGSIFLTQFSLQLQYESIVITDDSIYGVRGSASSTLFSSFNATGEYVSETKYRVRILIDQRSYLLNTLQNSHKNAREIICILHGFSQNPYPQLIDIVLDGSFVYILIAKSEWPSGKDEVICEKKCYLTVFDLYGIPQYRQLLPGYFDKIRVIKDLGILLATPSKTVFVNNADIRAFHQKKLKRKAQEYL